MQVFLQNVVGQRDFQQWRQVSHSDDIQRRWPETRSLGISEEAKHMLYNVQPFQCHSLIAEEVFLLTKLSAEQINSVNGSFDYLRTHNKFQLIMQFPLISSSHHVLNVVISGEITGV